MMSHFCKLASHLGTPNNIRKGLVSALKWGTVAQPMFGRINYVWATSISCGTTSSIPKTHFKM